jgi:hypothetical protein
MRSVGRTQGAEERQGHRSEGITGHGTPCRAHPAARPAARHYSLLPAVRPAVPHSQHLKQRAQQILSHKLGEVGGAAPTVGERGAAAGAPQRIEQPHKGEGLGIVFGAGLQQLCCKEERQGRCEWLVEEQRYGLPHTGNRTPTP